MSDPETAPRGRTVDALLPLLAALAALGLWHVVVVTSKTTVFPSPVAVVRGVGELVRKGLLASYIFDSLRRVASGYLSALALGIPTGLALGWFPALAAASNPVIQMCRPISPLAWMPLAILAFGVSEWAPVSLIFLGAFFPIVVATMNGVRAVPALYVQAGRNFGLGPAALLARVVFPAALPQVLTGLRLALGVAWLVVVAAEMIAVDSGLGYLIIDSRNAGKRYDLVIAGMLLIGLIGLALDTGARSLERLKAVRWGFARD